MPKLATIPSRATLLRSGLSLLEVILAVAILGGSLAAIGELVRIGSRHAEESRGLAAAQLLCESKMEEIAAGAAARETVSSTPCETKEGWQYSVTVTALDQAGLSEIRVTVEQSDRPQPLSFTLVRWMMDSTQQTGSGATPSSTSSQPASSGGSNVSGM